ncbi:MAG: exosome complex protein Rrp42 [Candidatus Aenigmarchaeota archaeon]|nr:exosome complex protein Rrp42 [Candidatus Aenigmarchaeota archaeon]
MIVEKEIIREIIERGSRLDGRGFHQFRDMKIETGVIPKAEGSARVEIGDTKVMVGVKLEPGEPFPDSPNEGILMVSCELVPLASPEFEPGPPGEEAIEIARVVDRAIRESNAIDLEKLVIKEGKVWKVMIDIVVLDDGGNLIDAASLGAISALLDTKIPAYTVEGDEIKIDRTVKETPLPLKRKPICVTVVKIGNKLLLDPNRSEEEAMDARLTLGVFEEDEEIKFCAMQKGGNGGITYEEFERILDLVTEKAKKLLKHVK